MGEKRILTFPDIFSRQGTWYRTLHGTVQYIGTCSCDHQPENFTRQLNFSSCFRIHIFSFSFSISPLYFDKSSCHFGEQLQCYRNWDIFLVPWRDCALRSCLVYRGKCMEICHSSIAYATLLNTFRNKSRMEALEKGHTFLVFIVCTFYILCLISMLRYFVGVFLWFFKIASSPQNHKYIPI